MLMFQVLQVAVKIEDQPGYNREVTAMVQVAMTVNAKGECMLPARSQNSSSVPSFPYSRNFYLKGIVASPMDWTFRMDSAVPTYPSSVTLLNTFKSKTTTMCSDSSVHRMRFIRNAVFSDICVYVQFYVSDDRFEVLFANQTHVHFENYFYE